MPNIFMEEEPQYHNVSFPEYSIVRDKNGNEHEILDGVIVTDTFWGNGSKRGGNRYLYYHETVRARIPHNSVSSYYWIPVNEIVALVSVP